MSLLLITHNLGIVAGSCDRVAVMYAGQIVEQGTVDAVFREPHHPYTLGLLRAVPDFDLVRGQLASIPGSPPDPVEPPVGCRFHPRCGFVREDCVVAPIPLIQFGGEREARCLHHEACAADARLQPVVAGG